MLTRSVVVGVDYHQLYLWDPSVTNRAPEEYSDEDVERRVKLGPSVIVVQPERNGEVALTVEVTESDPGFDAGRYDHVVECGVELPGGRLQVHECLGGAVMEATVEPGAYVARVLFAGLGSISSDGLDGDDAYAVQLWRGSPRALRVVKQWRRGEVGS